MRLENIVLDAGDAQLVGHFWAAALGLEVLTDEADVVEARLRVGEAWLDLCVVAVPEPPGEERRAHLDLQGGDPAAQQAVVDRLLGLGAAHADIGQGDVPWVVLADPEGTPFCVMEHRDSYVPSGPIAAIPLSSADPARDAAFYRAMGGWVPAEGDAPAALRHPAGTGPLLELLPEASPKRAKNRLHLDVRLEEGDDADAAIAMALDLGGSRRAPASGELPWVLLADPSGNEVCLLPHAAGA